MSNLPRMDVLFGSFIGAMVLVVMMILNGVVTVEDLAAPVTIIVMFVVFYFVKSEEWKLRLQGLIGAVITVGVALYSYYVEGALLDQQVVMTGLTVIFTFIATLVFPAVQVEDENESSVL